MENESIIKKIQKLLAKASSTDSIHEREALLLKAQELLLEYNLDASHLDLKVEVGILEEQLNYYDDWESTLLRVIAKNNFCRTVRQPWNKKINVIGKSNNISVCIYLHKFFNSTLLELSIKSYMKMCDERLGGQDPSKAQKNKYLNEYLLDGVHGIAYKMRMQKEEAMNNAKVSDLILINDTDVQKYVDEKYPNLRKSRGGSYNPMGSGYSNGFNDGSNIKTGNSRVTSGVKQIK